MQPVQQNVQKLNEQVDSFFRGTIFHDDSSGSQSVSGSGQMNITRVKKRKNNRRSAVWKFFNYDEENNIATCRYCQDFTIVFKKKQETTTLRRHILKFHGYTDQIRNAFLPRIRGTQFILDGTNIVLTQGGKNITKNKFPRIEQEYSCGDEKFIDMIKSKKSTKNGEQQLSDSFFEENGGNSRRAKRSVVWQIFMEKQKNKALCKLCEYQVSFKSGTTELIRHIKKFHEGVSLNQSTNALPFLLQKNKNPIKNNPIFQNSDKLEQQHSSSEINGENYEFLRKMEQQHIMGEYSPKFNLQESFEQSQYNKIHKKQPQNYITSNSFYTKIQEPEINSLEGPETLPNIRMQLEELSSEPNISIYQFKTEKDDVVRGAFIISEDMERKLCRYSEAFVMVYWKPLLPHANYQAVIFMFAQDQHITPNIIGLIPLFIEDQILSNIMFSQIFSLMINFNIGAPSLLIIGPQWLKKSYYKFAARSQPQLRLVYLQSMIFIQHQNEEETQLKKKLNKTIFNKILEYKSVKKISSGQKFVGFIQTSSFIHKTNKAITFLTLHLGSLKIMIDKYLEIKENMYEQIRGKHLQIVRISNQFEQIESLMHLLADNNQLQEFRQVLSAEIFIKVAYSYFHALLSIKLSKVDENFAQARQQKQEDIWKSNQSVWIIVYEYRKNFWYCDCGLDRFVGLPCCHLIKLLIEKRLSLWPYIDQRWQLNKNDKYHFNGKNNLSRYDYRRTSKINQKKQLLKALKSKWINFSEDKFLQIFWS